MNVFKHNFTWQVRADKRLVEAFTGWATKTWSSSKHASGTVKIGGISVYLNDLIYAHLKKVGAAPKDINPTEWRDGMPVPPKVRHSRKGALSTLKDHLVRFKVRRRG